MTNCPCNSQKSEASCCQPFITGQQLPPTPEALMRSRYTAFTQANMEYIKQTMKDKALEGFVAQESARWAKRVNWIKLCVYNASIETPTLGYVEFEATFVEGNKLKSIHEKSEFRQDHGRWYYVQGSHLPSTHNEQLVSRNSNCPCGSLSKYKNCHGS